jgi:hypothetical protein
MGAPGQPPCAPDAAAIAEGYSPEKPKVPGRYILRSWVGGMELGPVTVSRHSRGGLVMIPDPPGDGAARFVDLPPFLYLWREIT